MGTGTRPTVLRLCEIQKYIVDHGHATLQELAEHFSVSPRTVKRDIHELNKAPLNAAIAYDAKAGGYHCQNPASVTVLPLTDEEVQGLFLLRSLAESLHGTALGRAVQGALGKIKSVLPDSIQGVVDIAYPGVACFTDPLPQDPPTAGHYLRPLLLAIEHRQAVVFRYTAMSTHTTAERTVDPYLLFFRRGRWYLFGYCHARKAPRDFVLARIEALQVQPTWDAFTPPPRVELLDGLQDRFAGIEGDLHTVKVRFDAEWAPRVAEWTWHPTQQIEHLPDGACILTMRVEGLSTVAGWVMSYCGHAVPLEPPALVAEVKRAARGLITAR